uniref:Atos-like conserved domain-containing protein n=1 Tax=Meloidogyne enterolobii TaxID=390850 RepID=A0A6V7W6J5_MELEN|nr:unnamed protein product [Meloidogyne enterolobii]
MDLAKEFLAEVLNERICLASNFSSGNEKKNLTTTTTISSSSSPPTTNKQQESAIIEANKYLENLKSVSIHVLLGHSECKESGDKLCSAMQDTEVWTFKLHHQRPPDSIGRPPMLPLFLKQALRSQLHFSPLRSWLTANTTLPCGLFPVVRVLASDHLLSNPISSQVQSHKFPACCCSTTPNGGGIWLELCVQWLKREYFLSKAPILCPSIEMDCNDSWVLPPLSDTNNGLNQEQNQRPSSSLSSSLCSSSSDSDEDIQEEDESELSSSSSSSSSPIPTHSQSNINEQISHQKQDSTESNSNNNCNNNINNNISSLSRRNSQNIQSSLQFVNESQNNRRDQRRLRPSRPIQSSTNSTTTTIQLPSLPPKHSQLLQQYHHHHHHHQSIQRSRRLVMQRARKAATKKINDGPSIKENNSDNKQKEDKMEEDKAEKVKIENKKEIEENNKNVGGIEKMEYSSPQRLQQQQPSSQCSTPPPPFQQHLLLRGVNITPPPSRMLFQQRQHSSLSALHNNNKNSNNSFRRCCSARLVCNFEESILSGRLTPSSIVDGYSLQLMVVPTQSMVMAPGGGFFSVQRVKYPVQTFFFFNEMGGSSLNEISTRTPALLHLARCELDSGGIPIPRHCNLQAVLFNPQGSVIKIFMVEVDVRDMPPCSTTFIRQRTFCETKTGINNNYFPSSSTSSSSSSSTSNQTANKNLNI